MHPQAKDAWLSKKLEEARKSSLLEPSDRAGPRCHIDFGLLAPRTKTKLSSVILGPQVYQKKIAARRNEYRVCLAPSTPRILLCRPMWNPELSSKHQVLTILSWGKWGGER